jgi:HSP20 family protein
MPFWEDPWEEIERLHRRLHRLMRGIWEPISEEIVEPITAWRTFPVDVVETEDELIIKADLPGFKKEEVAIKATENTIEISAQKKEIRKEKTETVFRAERKFGALRRAFTLPVEVIPETAEAKMEDGVLEIRFKKAKPKKKAKEIKIK